MQHTSEFAQYATRYGKKLYLYKRDNPNGTRYSAPRPAGVRWFRSAKEADAFATTYAKPITKH